MPSRPCYVRPFLLRRAQPFFLTVTWRRAPAAQLCSGASSVERQFGGEVVAALAHVEWLLALVAEQPDLTLDEIVVAMRKQQIPGSRTAVNVNNRGPENRSGDVETDCHNRLHDWLLNRGGASSCRPYCRPAAKRLPR